MPAPMVVKLSPLQAFNVFRSDSGIRSDGWRFGDIKTQGGFSLASGAKIAFSHCAGYHIHGYHYAGEDVRPYVKFGTVEALNSYGREVMAGW